MNIDEQLNELGFIKDGENAYILKFGHHYIRVYNDSRYTENYNLRADIFYRSFKNFNSIEKLINHIKKLIKRLENEM